MRQFRRPTERDLDRMAALSARAYPVPGREESEMREWIAENPRSVATRDSWIAGPDGRHEVQGTVIPFEMFAWGRRWEVGGLAGVAVAPDARRRGWARDLVVHTEREARERGRQWAILYPFRVDFYSSLGYGVVELRESLIGPLAAVPDYDEAEDTATGTLADLEELLPVYHRFAEERDGFVARTADAWSRMLMRKPPFVAIHRASDGSVDGYALYRVEGASDHFLHQRVVVQELVWIRDAAWRGLWGFFARQRDQIAEFRVGTQGDGALVRALVNPSIPGGPILAGALHRVSERGVGVMAKILDPAVVAERRPYGPGQGTLSVTVHDPLEDTPARFTLDVTDGVGRTGPPAAGGDRLETDVRTWTELQCGATRLSEARRRGAAEFDGESAGWESVFNPRDWGLFDAF